MTLTTAALHALTGPHNIAMESAENAYRLFLGLKYLHRIVRFVLIYRLASFCRENSEPRLAVVSCPFKTHRSRTRVGDSVLVRGPVMLGSFSVGKRAVESGSNILNAIDAYCVAFKHRAAKALFN